MKRYQLLREEMKERHIDQSDIAAALKVPRSSVSRRFTGEIPWLLSEACAVTVMLGFGPQMLPILFREDFVAVGGQ